MAKVKIRKTKNAKKNVKKSDNAIPTGKTLGLRMQETWVKIFTDNESAPKNKKLTDEQIAAFMLKEFPTADSKPFQLMREKKRWAVQGQRARYNRGGMTQGEAPAKASHRYDSDGNYDDTPFSGKKGVTMDKLNPRFLPEVSKNSIANKKKKGAKTTKKVKVRLKK